MTDKSFPALEAKKAELKNARREMRLFFEQAGPDRDLSRVTCVKGDTAEKLAYAQEMHTKMEALGKEVEQLKALGLAADEAAKAEEDADLSAKGESFGSLFVKSAAYTGYRRGSAVGPTAAVNISAKTLFQTTAGWEPESVRSGLLVEYPTAPAPQVANLIPQGTIDQQMYVFEQVKTFSDSASETDEGGSYHEATLETEEVSLPVRKITVWIPVTDEQLEDVAEAESFVNSQLQLMVRKRLDRQILRGSGTGTPGQLLGTENVSGINSEASTGNFVDDVADMLDTIREESFMEPSAIIMRPSMWTKQVAQLKNSNGDYIWHHPASVGPKSLWGVPVATPHEATANKVVVGDYAGSSRLLVKRGIDMQITNAHDDFFVKGKQAIRADLRLVMVHLRPKAFGEITGITA